MIISDVSGDILALVNNTNVSTTRQFNWILATLNEITTFIKGGRWSWLLKNQIKSMDTTNKFLAKPTDFDELIEPIFFSTSETATTSWASPTTMWEFENEYALYSHKDDFRVSDLFGIEFHSRWNSTAGSIWLRYYRDMTMPASYSSTTAFDLPDKFVYRLMTYGPARFGLLKEDDYDRLAVCREEFNKTMTEMVAWDARRQIANSIKLCKSHDLGGMDAGPILPSTYSL